jgi:hypothetical protein
MLTKTKKKPFLWRSTFCSDNASNILTDMKMINFEQPKFLVSSSTPSDREW